MSAEPNVRKGDKIICENGHPIGEALRDLSPGDLNWSDAFGNWTEAGFQPAVGQQHLKCKICGARWVFPGLPDWMM